MPNIMQYILFPHHTHGCQKSAGSWTHRRLPPLSFPFLLWVGLRLLLPPALYLLARAFLLCRKKKGNLSLLSLSSLLYIPTYFIHLFRRIITILLPIFYCGILIHMKNTYHPIYQLTQGMVSSSSECVSGRTGNLVTVGFLSVTASVPWALWRIASWSLTSHHCGHIPLCMSLSARSSCALPVGHSHWVAVGVTTVVLGSSDISRPYCAFQPVHRIEWPRWSSRDFEWAQ